MNLLMYKALKWAIAAWEIGGKAMASYERFTDMFLRVFDHSLPRT